MIALYLIIVFTVMAVSSVFLIARLMLKKVEESSVKIKVKSTYDGRLK